MVFSLCEDYLGNLWVGTYLGWLDKFDKKTNTFIHNKIPNYPHFKYSVFSLFEDSDKTLWIGTMWGLFKYDRETNQFIRYYLSNKKDEYDGLIFLIKEVEVLSSLF